MMMMMDYFIRIHHLADCDVIVVIIIILFENINQELQVIPIYVSLRMYNFSDPLHSRFKIQEFKIQGEAHI